jgi:PadR family transcriptional regulator AphA
MVSVSRTSDQQLLPGEWACLGIIYPAPTHGFAVAARLKPTGDVGRVWSLSRPLTYRSLDQLTARGFIHAIGEEPGIAGGNRTILAASRRGRAQLRKWLHTPVVHLRDMRSELLLKLIIAELCGVDTTAMLAAQHDHIEKMAATLASRVDASESIDVVALWRSESSQAALRFLDRLSWYRDRGAQLAGGHE